CRSQAGQRLLKVDLDPLVVERDPFDGDPGEFRDATAYSKAARPDVDEEATHPRDRAAPSASRPCSRKPTSNYPHSSWTSWGRVDGASHARSSPARRIPQNYLSPGAHVSPQHMLSLQMPCMDTCAPSSLRHRPAF